MNASTGAEDDVHVQLLQTVEARWLEVRKRPAFAKLIANYSKQLEY